MKFLGMNKILGSYDYYEDVNGQRIHYVSEYLIADWIEELLEEIEAYE